MERFLEGRGYYRLLYAALVRTPDLADRFGALHEDTRVREQGHAVTFDRVVELATAVGTRLCASALRYIEALGRRECDGTHVAVAHDALRRDLRNWDLDTGYYIEAAPDESGRGARVVLRHSWPHFAREIGGAKGGAEWAQ
jgi:hypothetical protein